MKKINDLIRLLFRVSISAIIGKNRAMHWLADDLDTSLLYLPKEGYLEETGWINSIKVIKPIDKNGKHIPWLTYPFIRFLEGKLNNNLSLLEFGSGSSTIYFSSKLKKILSFEDDNSWFNVVRSQLSDPSILHLYRLHEEIGPVLDSMEAKPDIVLIDSIKDRLEFAKLALKYISDEGVIILDDIDHKEQTPIVELLTSYNYKKIDFWGLAPMIRYQKCTSVFYKQNNCFNI